MRSCGTCLRLSAEATSARKNPVARTAALAAVSTLKGRSSLSGASATMRTRTPEIGCTPATRQSSSAGSWQAVNLVSMISATRLQRRSIEGFELEGGATLRSIGVWSSNCRGVARLRCRRFLNAIHCPRRALEWGDFNRSREANYAVMVH